MLRLTLKCDHAVFVFVSSVKPSSSGADIHTEKSCGQDAAGSVELNLGPPQVEARTAVEGSVLYIASQFCGYGRSVSESG